MTFSAKDLFAAAREDAPSEPVREAVWSKVAASVGAPSLAPPPAPAPAPPTEPALGLTTVTTFIVGTAVGAGLVAAVAMGLSDPGAPARAATRRTPAVVSTERMGATRADTPPRPLARAASATSARAAAPASASASASDSESSLEEEARLVTAARRELMASHPERALELVKRAKRLDAHRLEPEEWSIEARSLRALGRVDEALAIELALRSKYPGHALAQ